MNGPEQRGASNRSTQGRVGFETGSDTYERSRPGYPDDAVLMMVDQAGIGPGTRVLDLAAGTGKLTRQLLPFGASCIAVEPSASMRDVLSQAIPGLPVVAGTAEMIPLVTDTVDAVVVAQAFHWFDAPVALAEIGRVLRPGGGLCLVWNERDETDPMMVELTRITQWVRYMPYQVGMDFSPVVEASQLFGPVIRSKFRFVQGLDRQAYVDQVASRSYVQVLPDSERNFIMQEAITFAASLDEPIPMPYVTSLYCATRRA